MIAYAYISARFESGQLIKIISEDGYILECIEPRTTLTKIKEVLWKFVPGYEVEWLDRPWSNEGYKEAVRRYELNHGLRMDCREY